MSILYLSHSSIAEIRAWRPSGEKIHTDFPECFNFGVPLNSRYLRKAISNLDMTPELKTACELVFQEHKTSPQIRWSRDSFRGQISIGLSELAKEILVQKKIIILPDRSKKFITFLNPVVADAGSVEEAEKLIASNPKPVLTTTIAKAPKVVVQKPALVDKPAPIYLSLPHALPEESTIAAATAAKWYLKPVFFYFVWPVCAAVAGAGIAYLLNLAFTEIFWR